MNRGKIAHYHLPSTANFQAQGVFWYPNQGYREWHTNYDYENDQPSTEFRMYMIDIEEENSSFFYYLDRAGQLQRVVDKAEVVNLFLFPARQKFGTPWSLIPIAFHWAFGRTQTSARR